MVVVLIMFAISFYTFVWATMYTMIILEEYTFRLIKNKKYNMINPYIWYHYKGNSKPFST